MPQARVVIAMLWVGWILSWLAAAAWAKRPVKRLGRKAERGHGAVTGVGIVLLFWRWKVTGMWITPPAAGWAAIAAVAAGIAFAWWARIHLGALWSGTITRKADHRVVDTGPYALVRHPIYTGLILAAFATALERGTLLALAGAVLVTVGFSMKARLEEGFLREQLGAADYDAYARRTPMLIPWTRF